MSSQKTLVLDANILIRAVLGRRVRNLLKQYEGKVQFYAPEICFLDVNRHLPTLLQSHEIDDGLEILGQIALIVEAVDRSLYGKHENAARERISVRDPDDWPILATAMFHGCGIWTEDQDFFGSGIAVWTTDRVEFYLRESS
jgi:predicted nucleic acid-binding protein